MSFMHVLFLLFTFWLLSVSSYDGVYDDPRDLSWALQPDLTHDELLANDFGIPEVASQATEIRDGLSYIVKLDCLSCPFDIRSPYARDEYEQPGRPNSLVSPSNLRSWKSLSVA